VQNQLTEKRQIFSKINFFSGNKMSVGCRKKLVADDESFFWYSEKLTG
jgi:hypothetical protein